MRWTRCHYRLRVVFAITALLCTLAALPVGAARKPSFKKSEFKLEYRDTLIEFAGGDTQSAVTSLVELESRTSQNGAHLEPQWKAKLSVIRDIMGGGADVLVPVSQLHQRAYLAHLERGSHSLAAHSRSLTMELAELYAERARGAHGERVASAVMTSLAGYLHAAFMDSTASGLYRRAIDIDPNNGAALLGLVGILERHGDYREALPLLRRLAEVSPADAEGRLRLAVHLVRLGKEDEAERLLRALVEEPVKEPRWLHSLAYQELARLLLDREEFAPAAKLLEDGTRALPGDPTLPILLAFASDRNGRPSSKAKLTAALHEGAATGLASPRYLYSQMPRRALEEVRAVLQSESAAQLPILAEALGGGDLLADKRSR